MQLLKIESYRMDNKDFKSLKQAQTYLENEIGKIIDSSPLPLAPRDRLAVFYAIVKNKARLCALLSVVFDPDDGETEIKNLLDLDL